MDLEFTGLRQDTTPISLGIVYPDGSEFYAEFIDYDRTQLTEWLHENVINKLSLEDMEANSIRFDERMCCKYVRGTKDFIAQELDFWHQYIMNDYNEKIHVWSDCSAYDWVLFCEMFGGSFKLPKNISYIPFDICTMFELQGIDPDINREEFVGNVGDDKHSAIHDARVIKKCYEKLKGGAQ
jgi:hypothetical protein